MEGRKIFISYSRKDLAAVKEIKTKIENVLNVECWMDLSSVRLGSSFPQEIITGIDNCSVFMFMLSVNSQDSEFALLELNYAHSEGKQVVIVNIDGCKMIKAFKLLYGLIDVIVWDDIPQRNKLLRDLKRWIRPLDEIYSVEEVNKVQQISFLKLKSDMDCIFYLDGDEKSKLKANTLVKIPLREGEYELKFVSVEHDKDVVIEDFPMPSFDKRHDVKLLPLRDERLEKERNTENFSNKAIETKTTLPEDDVSKFFPLFGITLGKTTWSDVERLGYKIEIHQKNADRKKCSVRINNVDFWDHESDGVFSSVFWLPSNCDFPEQWSLMGFSWANSYDDWLKVFMRLGFMIKIIEAPQLENNSLKAMFEALSSDGKLLFVLDFCHGDFGGETFSPNSIFSIEVIYKTGRNEYRFFHWK